MWSAPNAAKSSPVQMVKPRALPSKRCKAGGLAFGIGAAGPLLHYGCGRLPKVAAVVGGIFGDIRPAATCIVCGLIDARMKIEIEVTARREV